METEKEVDRGGGESGVDESYGYSARAFFSSDFDWEELREEIENSRCPEVGSILSKALHRSKFHIPKAHDPDEFEVDLVHLQVGYHHVSHPVPASSYWKTGFDVLLEAERRHEAEGRIPAFSSSAWDAFHKNHSKALFFKERRYLVKEFPELVNGSEAVRVLEVGCGTGSSVAPILRASALDRAKLLVVDQAGLHESQSKKFQPFLCDISVEAFPSWLCCTSCRLLSNQSGSSRDENNAVSGTTSSELMLQAAEGTCCVGGVKIVMLIFTLSAIPLEKMRHVLAECAAVLQPGGCLLFRDYGLYDMTMLRFPSSQKVADRLYFRKDGTLAYFFTLEVVRELFTSVGLIEEELQYACVQLVNRRKQVPMKRVWVHAKFRKPVAVSPSGS